MNKLIKILLLNKIGEMISGLVLLSLLFIMALTAIVIATLSYTAELLWELLVYIFSWCNHCGSHELENDKGTYYCRECHKRVD